MNCPKCRRKQYSVCSNSKCVCQTRVPKNAKSLIWTEDGDGLKCPYCGFTAHIDYWEERDMKEMEKK